jgi:pimeloyl-ACP methyl ester carboxylesterase
MSMTYVRRGAGKPLLLVHGIGSSHHSWDLIIDRLAADRDVIAVDLPGSGNSPALAGPTSIRTLADALTDFLAQNDLTGIDAVGSSMGGRLVLELARRGGVLGAVVALDPGGFWQGWEVPVFYQSVRLSAKLVGSLQPVLPLLTGNPVTRTLLFAQFSARPWALPAPVALQELRTFVPSPEFSELLDNLAHGEPQQGAPAGSIAEPLVIGWGRQDLVTLPVQAKRAVALFPDAHLHWFANCGHFPQLDAPEQTAQLIIDVTDGAYMPQATEAATDESVLVFRAKPFSDAWLGAAVVLTVFSLVVMLRRKS